MLKPSDIEECPYCQVSVKPGDVQKDVLMMGSALSITCQFCTGTYVVFERTPSPFTREEIEMMWQGLKPPKKKPHPWGGRSSKDKGKKKKS